MNWRELVQKPWAIATAAVIAVGIVAVSIDGDAWLILLLIFLGLAVGFGVVWFIRRWREGRQSAKFRAGLNQNASKAPGNINDPSQRVELDRLRQKFNDGFQRVIEEGRRKGVDFLYRHPWIMVVGEPGSGKTEAIRHSGIVSPRMQDELQGVGGTLNMDWWFTERAVILDTAGRMVFEEEAGTANNEFQEFLRLLRKGRQLTPINGLLVTVSADTLVGGTDDQIRERSTKLGEKIAQIQSVLEVRFPVYVVVTKCDKITGFREFFESLDEPAMLNQILGWSNPEPLDVAFKPEQVEEHLKGVIDTLRFVRFRLLDRSAGLGATGTRRTDEVDSLFAFPYGLKMLAARLKLYLEPVFAAGEWSASAPLFVRGVYFSSALWQGAVLDQELAAALGVPVDKLGDDGKVFRRDRALFIRDLFVEKMLPERGLVTASHRTEGIVLRRRIITWSTLAVVLVMGIGAFWWAHSILNGGVAKEVELWRLAAANRSTNGYAPLIDRGLRPGEWKYAGEQFLDFNAKSSSAADDPKRMKRVTFHRELEASTQKELDVPLVFRFGGDVNELRRKAQNTILVTDLVQPIVLAARDRISAPETKWEEQHTQVFSMLLQLETAVQAGGEPVPRGDAFLGPFLNFSLRPPASDADAKGLYSLFDSSYHSPPGTTKPVWPPRVLSGGATLAENAAMKDGLENLKRNQEEKKGDVARRIRTVDELRDVFIEFKKFEEKLPARRPLESWKEEIRKYAVLRDKIDQKIEMCVKERVFAGPLIQMDAAIGGIVKDVQGGNEELIKTIVARPFARARLDPDTLARFTLPKEVQAEVTKWSEGESQRVAKEFPESKRSELKELDQQFLTPDASGMPRYKVRVELLRNLIAPPPTENSEVRLIGNLAKHVAMVADAPGAEKAAPVAPGAGAARPVPPVSDPVLRAARELLIELYVAEFDAFLERYAWFPLVSDRTEKPLSQNDLPVVRRRLLSLKEDVDSLTAMGSGGRPAELKNRVARYITLMDRVLPALISTEDELAQIKVHYPDKSVQADLVRQVRARHVWINWRILKFSDRLLRAEGEKEEEIGDFSLLSDNLRIGFQRVADTPASGLDEFHLTPLAQWQLLRQMLDPRLPAPSRSDDGRKWRVLFSRQDDGPEKYYFALSVTFPNKLPLVADWPKWQQLKSP